MAKRQKVAPDPAPLPTPGVDVSSKYQEVVVLGVAAKEGYDVLTPGQYLHVKDLIKQLVGFGRREFGSILRLEKLDEFWELKEKGGTLGKKNIRVYFKFNGDGNEVVVLCTYKKEDDGSAPPHIVFKLRNRWRLYQKGDFQDNCIRYQRPSTSSD
ncbi:hypothetical protein [Lacipirellula parvula]|uniref:Toxin HigB n=1 Tax=Lacipirellula parvula TaxID=2650471 RepID=A0A5K7X6A0_9BACT|nr:hypothetical protein [Lacipirellula parvula]BBO32100.1 hypothetical protein PLANPX_1712 [Lacipirellula parvula]